MNYEAVGKLYKKYETESKSASFQAREFVIEVNDNNYMQYIKFQLTQDKCSVIDPFEVGQEVKVTFNLRGREWNEKFFTNLNAWKVEGNVSASAQDENPFPPGDFPEFDEKQSNDNPFGDDLPF